MRPAFLLVVGAALLVIAAVAYYLAPDGAERDTAAVASSATPSPSPLPGPAASKDGAATKPAAPQPSFDIVRINPDGDAVIAGRAAPGAAVTVLDGERVVGRVTADARGEWVLVPDAPLPGGRRELRLQAERDGAPPIGSDQVVTFDVPARAAAVASAGGQGSALATTGATGQTIQPGDSLWNIARDRYGRGTDYAVIYQANRTQIRDPDLIYPGQVFVIPQSR